MSCCAWALFSTRATTVPQHPHTSCISLCTIPSLAKSHPHMHREDLVSGLHSDLLLKNLSQFMSIYTSSNSVQNHRKWCSSDRLSCNLIGLHSWLQWNKSACGLDTWPSSACVCARVWLCQTTLYHGIMCVVCDTTEWMCGLHCLDTQLSGVGRMLY